MNRWLLILLALIGLIWWMKARRSSRSKASDSAAEQATSKTKSSGAEASERPTAPQDMVACAHCQVHLPRSESLLSLDGQSTFCCASHLQAGPRPPASSQG